MQNVKILAQEILVLVRYGPHTQSLTMRREFHLDVVAIGKQTHSPSTREPQKSKANLISWIPCGKRAFLTAG